MVASLQGLSCPQFFTTCSKQDGTRTLKSPKAYCMGCETAILYWATSESIWDPPVLTAVIFCGGIYHISVSWQCNLQYYCIVHDQIWVSGEFSRERLTVSHLHTCLSIFYSVYIDCLWRPPVCMCVIQYAAFKMMSSFRTIFLICICDTALPQTGGFFWDQEGYFEEHWVCTT